MCLWRVIGVYVSDKCLVIRRYFSFSENILQVLVSVYSKAGYLLSTFQMKDNSEVFQCLLFLIFPVMKPGSQVTPCTIEEAEGLAVFISSLM